MARLETRGRARALQALYAWDLRDGQPLDRVALMLWDDLEVAPEERAFADALLRIIQVQGTALDAELGEVTTNWRIERLGARANPLVDRAIASGNVVANHTFHHARMCSSPAEVGATEIDRTRELLAAVADMPIVWFRTPYGSRCPTIERLLDERGLAHFHWDIDPQEWRTPSRDHIVDHVVARLARESASEAAHDAAHGWTRSIGREPAAT